MRKAMMMVGAWLVAAAPAQAAEMLQDGSFETPVWTPGNYVYPLGLFGSWSYAGPALVAATGSNAWYGATPPSGQDGAQFVALQQSGILSQSFTASASSATLSWIDTNRIGYGGNQTYDVRLAAKTLGSYATFAGQPFATRTVAVTGLTVGQSYTLSFVGTNMNGGDNTSFIDKVSLMGTTAAAVPEPASWALMIVGVGAAGAGLRRRRVLRLA